ncbi:MAG: S1C family serine protease [Pyrinomonadaceae bacterium]
MRLEQAQPRRRWIAADVRLAPGNSGGPLANALGQVIGINTMIAQGLGLAVPSNAVNSFVRRFERSGQQQQQQSPRIGVDLVAASVPTEGEAALGLVVMRVLGNSPGEHAGLLIGDVIVGAESRFFYAADDLASAWDEALERSRALTLNLLRGGELMTCDVAATQSNAQKAEAA